MIEKCAGAQNDRGLAARNKRRNDRPEKPARRAFDDQVGDIAERLDRQHRGRVRQTGKPAAMLFGMLHRHSGKGHPCYSPVQRFHYPCSDRSEASNRNPQLPWCIVQSIPHRLIAPVFPIPTTAASRGSRGAVIAWRAALANLASFRRTGQVTLTHGRGRLPRTIAYNLLLLLIS